jgi:hypothetical protein
VKSFHAHAAGVKAEREPALPLGPVPVAEYILWKLRMPGQGIRQCRNSPSNPGSTPFGKLAPSQA